jgi:hypothetical protein
MAIRTDLIGKRSRRGSDFVPIRGVCEIVVGQGVILPSGRDEFFTATSRPTLRPLNTPLAKTSNPECLGFGRADVHPEHLAPAVAVDADRDDHGHRHDAAVLGHLHVGGVDPKIWPVALDRPCQEGLHLLVDLGAEPADLALGDPTHPHRLHQVVHRARRHAVNVGLAVRAFSAIRRGSRKPGK